MKKLFTTIIVCCVALAMNAQSKTPCGPVPNENQLRWQEMEMYAFIHYSLNTYTDQEWGFGNEDPKLFNPSNLDCRQWARVCKQAGMKGIIFTAKHHCGFCMWPSKYTEYSVKNSPWKNGQGDVVRELAEACKEEGLEYAVYLSPWDRNHPEYGKPAYVTYFRNQLRELLTEYGDMFEVWFDGANGGDGWYGGANEMRRIDRTTYYEWPETYKMIRELQPKCLIWNDGSDRGDLRWVGTEAGNIGETNWSLLNDKGDVPYEQLHYGLENGNVWCPGETNTSIRPGWFYHETENENVKSLSKLMDTYYKSVGRNSCLLLNFPIAPNGRIHPTDSLRGIAFNKMIHEVFKTDLTKKAKKKTNGNETIITFKKPTTFNRFVAEEDIRYGQRVKKFSLEAEVNGQWVPLKDELVDNGDGLTTIGHRRIICFPKVTATRLRFTVTDAKCDPIIQRTSVYLAPDITQDTPDAGEKHASDYYIFFGADKMMFVTLNDEATVTGFRYLPPQDSREGLVTHYRIAATTDWQTWETLGEGEFSNIVNNPIWQTVRCKPTRAKVIRVEGLRLAQGERMGYSDVEVLTENAQPMMYGGGNRPNMDSLRQITAIDYADMLAKVGVSQPREGRQPNSPDESKHPNYDELTANPYPFYPDPMITENGKKVTSTKMWNKVRRPEIVRLFEDHVYGRVPANTPNVRWEVTNEEKKDFAGTPVVVRYLKGVVDNSSYPAITVEIQANIVYPDNGKQHMPVIIEFGFGGDPLRSFGGGVSWKQMVIERGWAAATINPSSIQADSGSGLTNGIIGLCNKGKHRQPTDWGSLRAWGWGLSRLIDYLETDQIFDATKCAIEGVSRYGKASLVAMAFEPRIAAGFIASSGKAGAAGWRRDCGESIGNIISSEEYHWVCGNLIKYGTDPLTENDIPVDQHELIALCAPRACFISTGSWNGDKWQDVVGSFISASKASPVYELFGYKGIGTDLFPGMDNGLMEGRLTYRQHHGGHEAGPNWPYFLDFFEREVVGK